MSTGPLSRHKIAKWTKIISRLCEKFTSSRVNVPAISIAHSTPKVCNGPWSVLFFGTDEFALRSLQRLYVQYENKSVVNRLEVVTAYKGQENAVIKYAKEHSIIVHKWPLDIKKDEFQIGIVVSFGHLIPSRIIDSFPLGMINVHGSLLPRWRGASPLCHALMSGDTRTGVSIMKIMPKQFDIGAVIAKQETDIKPDETYPDLYERIAQLGADLLVNTMEKLPDILSNATPQNLEEVTYAPKVTPQMTFVNWNKMTARNVYNMQRGILGMHPLRTHFNGKVIKLCGVRVLRDPPSITPPKYVPGLVLYDRRTKVLRVLCRDNSWISLKTVIIPERKPMSPVDFASGFICNRKEKYCIFN